MSPLCSSGNLLRRWGKKVKVKKKKKKRQSKKQKQPETEVGKIYLLNLWTLKCLSSEGRGRPEHEGSYFGLSWSWREVSLSWMVWSRLGVLTLSFDLQKPHSEENAYQDWPWRWNVNTTYSWRHRPSPKVFHSGVYPSKITVITLAFFTVIQFCRNPVLLTPSVNVGAGERLVVGISEFSMAGLTRVIWIVLYQWTSRHPGWIFEVILTMELFL